MSHWIAQVDISSFREDRPTFHSQSSINQSINCFDGADYHRLPRSRHIHVVLCRIVDLRSKRCDATICASSPSSHSRHSIISSMFMLPVNLMYLLSNSQFDTLWLFNDCWLCLCIHISSVQCLTMRYPSIQSFQLDSKNVAHKRYDDCNIGLMT